MSIQKFKRGQIWWMKDFSQYNEHIQGGTRPVIIISNDSANRFSTNITVIPCTSAEKKDMPTHVKLDINGPSTALAESLTTIPNSNLSGYIGTCDNHLLNKVDDAVKVALGLAEIPTKLETNVKLLSLNEVKSCINKSVSRGRKSQYSKEDMARLVNDYENHDVEYMLKKYNLSDKKALQNKVYRFRKLLSEGE